MTITRFLAGLTLASAAAMWIHDARAAEWDTTERIMFGTFVGLQVIDAAQTHYAVHHPDQFRESNPILGDHPSDAKVIAFKAVAVGAVYWLVKDADPLTRKLALGFLDGFYIEIVNHNRSIGVKIGF